MNEQKEFPNPPEVYTINTGEEVDIEERKDRFFDEVINFIGYDLRARRTFCEVQAKELGTSNELANLLIVRDILVASVIARRDDLNFWQVASAHYLTEDIMTQLREGIVE